jgi:hypothetical protein
MVVCGAEASDVRKAETVECALAAAAVIKTKHLEPGLPRGYMVNDDSEIPWLPGGSGNSLVEESGGIPS